MILIEEQRHEGCHTSGQITPFGPSPVSACEIWPRQSPCPQDRKEEWALLLLSYMPILRYMHAFATRNGRFFRILLYHVKAQAQSVPTPKAKWLPQGYSLYSTLHIAASDMPQHNLITFHYWKMVEGSIPSSRARTICLLHPQQHKRSGNPQITVYKGLYIMRRRRNNV